MTGFQYSFFRAVLAKFARNDNQIKQKTEKNPL